MFGSISLKDASNALKTHELLEIKDMKTPMEGISFRARLDSVRALPKMAFLILRNENHETIQACVFGKGELYDYVAKQLKKESIVIVHGDLVSTKSPVKSCTVKDFEISISRVYCVGEVYQPERSTTDSKPEEAQDELLTYADMIHPEDSPNTLAPGLKKRLDNRILDLRSPFNHAVFKCMSKVSNFMRQFLLENDFMEIYTPKIIAAASEGGSEFFTVDYFGRNAYLAQSPQLYKQMAICADFGRVFTVGPVFRAENSNTHRHLCEFTGFDLEMTFKYF